MCPQRESMTKRQTHARTHTNKRKTCGIHFGRLCRKPGCLFTALAECFLKRGCLLNHQFQPDASFTPLWLFLKPYYSARTFQINTGETLCFSLATTNPVSHANVLSGIEDLTHNHTNILNLIQTNQSLSKSVLL